MAPFNHSRALLLALAAATPRAETPVLELPPGPCGDAWARAAGWSAPRAALEPAPGAVALALDEGAWSRPETWSGWADVLGRLADAPGSAAASAERAALATLALRQARFDDAWAHLARVADAAELAALWPSFLPGVPAGTDVAAPLADGVVLRPAPPPPSVGAREGFVDRREVRLSGLAVGAALIDLRLAIEPDGVQVDVVHAGGGPARLAVVVPEPVGFDVRYEYVDWERQEATGAPIAIELAPGETRTLYGRTVPEWIAWPSSPAPGELPAAARAGGLVLVTEDATAQERMAALAGGLARLLDVECRAAATVPAELGVAVHLDGADEGRERRLAALASAVEAFVLAGR